MNEFVTEQEKRRIPLAIRFDPELFAELDRYVNTFPAQRRPDKDAVVQEALRSYLASRPVPRDPPPAGILEEEIPPQESGPPDDILIEEFIRLLGENSSEYRAFRQTVTAVLHDRMESRNRSRA